MDEVGAVIDNEQIGDIRLDDGVAGGGCGLLGAHFGLAQECERAAGDDADEKDAAYPGEGLVHGVISRFYLANSTGVREALLMLSCPVFHSNEWVKTDNLSVERVGGRRKRFLIGSYQILPLIDVLPIQK